MLHTFIIFLDSYNTFLKILNITATLSDTFTFPVTPTDMHSACSPGQF